MFHQLLFPEARKQAALPKELTLIVPAMTTVPEHLRGPGIELLFLRTMGHRDVQTAMHYQHFQVEVLRAAADYGTPSDIAEGRYKRKSVTARFAAQLKTTISESR